jgi:hypothetical protein
MNTTFIKMNNGIVIKKTTQETHSSPTQKPFFSSAHFARGQEQTIPYMLGVRASEKNIKVGSGGDGEPKTK